jgi:hypothetical protein
LLVLVHIPHSIEMILSASVPCSAGGTARGETRGVQAGCPQRRAGLEVVEAKHLMVLLHVPHSIELILSASVPCSAGGRRAGVTRGCTRGALNAGQAWLERLEKEGAAFGRQMGLRIPLNTTTA